MEEPEHCGLCGKQLRVSKHRMAHEGAIWPDAELRTCPENFFGRATYEEPRHDEWHLCPDGWVKREP